MRILHILEATSGGTRRHVLDLLPALQARGVSCSLIYSSLRNPLFSRDVARLRSQNIQTHEIPMGHRWARREDALALRALYAHLATHPYDLIHCHSSNAGLLGRLANGANCLQRRSTPLVYTPHYVAFAAGIPRAQRRVALYLEKLLAPQTTHFIAVSQHEKSVLRRVLKLDAARVSVVYNGVNGATHDTKNTISGAPFVIGCFGRLTAQKNQSVLIRALPLILQAVPEARLKLVGSGEDASTLRALAMRLNCDHRVEFAGEIPDPHAEYSACDLVAQPSRWEGCSYAILEAMSARRAIIASTAGGTPELLADAGVLLAPREERAWAKQIVALARSGHRREILGARAAQRAREYFGLNAMVEKTLAIYRAVLENSNCK